MSLCPAVANGDVELVRVLLARGADPNELGSYMGQCAIEWAMHMLKKMTRSKDYDAVRNIFACVELCLDAGALPDGPPTDSRNNPPLTPLGSAVDQCRPEFVRLLLSARADPNVPANPNGFRTTILHHAVLRGHRAPEYNEIVRLLLAAGADHASQNNPPLNETPFRIAVCHGYHRLWPLFLQAGAEIPNSWKRMQAYNEEQGDTLVAQRYEYLRMIEAAGGFKAYEKAHTRALASMLATNFTAHIPEEIFPRVVAFWAHTGFYVSAAAVAALPRAAETNPNQGA